MEAGVTDETTRRELDAQIVAFGEAWARGDADALKDMLSRSYTHTTVRGRLQNREEWLEYARGRGGATTDISFADVTTRLVGDVAIITGRNDIKGENDGWRNRSLLFTQVWVRSDGHWLREAFQATFVSG
jgi:ketosteroid isomerase-like protein